MKLKPQVRELRLRSAYQLCIRFIVRSTSEGSFPLLASETPLLHFFISHELQSAITDAEESQTRSLVQPSYALVLRYRP